MLCRKAQGHPAVLKQTRLSENLGLVYVALLLFGGSVPKLAERLRPRDPECLLLGNGAPFFLVPHRNRI